MWWVITSVWVLTLTAVATAQTSPPVITHFLAKDLANPEDVKVKAGEGFRLSCEASGSNLTWTWKHNDIQIMVDDSTFSLLDNGTLVGHNLLANNSGTYECSAKDEENGTVAISRKLKVVVTVPPSLTTRPSDKKISENEEVTFKCAAIGKPAPRIWWVRNGVDLPEGETLRFAANRSHSGKYWCLVDNGVGEVLNASAYLDVLYAPELASKPEDTTVIEGATVTLHCNATGNPRPDVTWHKDGNTVGTEETLSFVTKKNHSGKYWCTADNGFNSTASVSINLNVQFPPSFVETPSDQIVLEGGNVTFRCLATGNPTPAIQWFQDGELMGSGETLTFKANREHDGKYWCSVSNRISEAINTSANLAVHYLPRFTIMPRNKTLHEDAMVAFYCEATGNPTPTITWTKDGKTVGERGTLSFATNRDDSGEYMCSADNGLEAPITASVFLDVQYAPSLTTNPSNQTVIETDNAVFRCAATGNPTPQITWTKDGTTVGTGETLSFEAFRNQSGRYWCSANNGFSSTANASAYLDVQFLPTLTTKAINQTVNVSDHVTLHCSATGNPVPKITWYKDGEALTTGSELNFTALRNSSGKYWCLANNELNVTVNSIAYLNVQYPPSFTRKPENQTVAEYEKATLNCEATGNPVPEIKWMKDGMTVGQGNTLILEALRNKTGQYLCLAYNGLGEAIKARFHLDVQYAPELASKPEDTTVIEGATVTLHCNATGNPRPDVTWHKDGNTVGTEETLSFVTKRNHSGRYWCTADNGFNSTTPVSINLDVQFPSSLLALPTNQTVMEGDNVTFHCSATGNPSPVIVWLKGGEPVVSGETLAFEADRNHSGQYWCSASNGVGVTVNASAHLDVQYQPSFITKPSDQTVTENEQLEFRCSAIGNPAPKITWIKDGNYIGNGETLSFGGQRNLSGEYWCSADNGLGEAINSSATLDVQFPPSFIETPVDQIVLEGGNVTFRCLATGNPTPAIQWFQDGELMGSGETLTFEANREHDGKYWCSVSNGISEAINTSANLDVHYLPRFTIMPSNKTLHEDAMVAFYCEATANPTPTITWTKDGKTVGERGTLSFATNRDDSGEYMCSADNGLEAPITASVFLDVQYAPRLTTSPSNQTVIETDNAVFRCAATGNPTPQITWTKDGTTVGTGETLSFEAFRNQSGRYWCSANNGFSSTANASAYLDVQFLPTLTSKAFNQTVNVSDHVTLHCSATGNPVPKITWYKDGEALTTGSELNFTALRNSSGKYWCLANNELNVTVNSIAYLNVQYPPSFTRKPENQTVAEYEKATLNCEATGNPVPEIKWMKDGRTVGQGNTLILEALRNKTGQYLCLAYNGLGEAIKARFHLDVQYAPELASKPEDTTVIEGATVTLHCNATGNPRPDVTWHKDGNTVGTEETLSFVTKRNHSGRYWCTADNGFNSTTPVSINLDVQFPPSLIETPSDQIVLEGGNVTFRCLATGNPSPAIQWFQDGELMGSGETLTFKANREHDGKYWCSVSNGISEAINTSANLDVHYLPRFTIMPSNKTLHEDAMVAFYCEATGNPTPTITWTKDGKTVGERGTLSFATNRNDSGEYMCSADNGLDAPITASVFLDVQYAPSLTTSPSNQTVIETDNAVFRCAATGNPTPQITWTKDGTTVGTGETLSFEAFRNQSGRYGCSANNGFSSTANASAFLDVQFLPTLTSKAINQTVNVSDHVTLHCSATGNPVPKITWYKDGEALTTGSELNFTALRNSSGKYWCLANNELNVTVNSIAYLNVQYPPSFTRKPENQTVAEYEKATLNCEATGNPVPEIKWMKDGRTVGQGNTLILEALRNKTGQYLCLAYNGLGEAIKARFHLDVQYAPELASKPEDTTVIEGATVTLHCNATGNPRPGVTWHKDGNTVGTEETLSFVTKRNHSGRYWCTADNGFNSTTPVSINLNVQFPPSLLALPTNQTVMEGDNVTFHCSATGNPSPVIVWLKGGESVVSGETLAFEADRNHSGQYWCSAGNGVGVTVNASAHLDVQYRPSFITKPSDQTVTENEQLEFRCSAIGNPAPKITWIKDGNYIGNGETLSFGGQRNLSGEYWCSADNGLGEAINSSATLDVQFPPSLIETPIGQIVLEGGNVTFRCLATGNPTPAIQWFQGGELMGSGETLTFKANREHDGKYWCSVSNGISEAINTSANLDVHYLPRFTIMPSNKTLHEDAMVAFYCEATANPTPTITWTKDGKTVGERGTLSFATNRDDSGEYMCSADNGLDAPITASVFLDVQYAPRLTTSPSNQTVIETDNAVFRCAATGNPTPQITWTKDGTTVGTGEILSFEAFRNQSGRYWCSANNGFSSTANASAYLDVQFFPTLTTKAINQTVNVSDHVTLHCSATGNPVPKITWYKDGEALTTGSELKFTALRNSSGKYWCLANNELNVTVNSIAYLNVQFPSNLIRRPSDQTVIEGTNVTFHCDASGNPLPKLTWIKDGKTVGTGEKLSFEAQRNKSGKYWCLADNGVPPSANASAFLGVHFSPRFSMTPVDQTVRESEKVVFNCTAVGNPTPNITWTKDGKTVGTGDTLSLEATKNDSGDYQCSAGNEISDVTTTVYLDVQFPASIVNATSNQTATEGTMARLHCSATGNPAPEIAWIKDGMPVGRGETLALYANRNQSGEYWCTADNGFEPAVNATAYLDVQYPPSFSRIPIHQTVREGENITLYCTAVGNPTTTITWTKDGKTVGTDSTLSLDATRNDTGQYQCSAGNGIGEDIATVVYINVTYPPSLVSMPANVTVTEGVMATMHCSATGNPIPDITWIKDGKTVGRGETLKLEGKRNQIGEYWCTAENGLTSTANASAYLDVQYPPSLTSTPVGKTVKEGDEITLHCTASGNPSPKITWTRDGKFVSEGNTMRFVAHRNQSGKYWCSADNGVGRAVNTSAYLSVLFSPQATIKTSYQVVEGSVTQLRCSVIGNPSPDITWSKDGIILAKGAILRFTASRSQSGEYTCLADNGLNRTANVSTYLDVHFKPERTIISVDLDITIPVPFGSSVAFNCTTFSYPDPDGYNFYYNDQELGSNNTGIYHHQLRRSGDYSCVPFNSAGKGKKALLRIVVRASKPSFDKEVFGPFYLFKGIQARLPCKPVAEPYPTFKWLKDGVALRHGKNDTYRIDANGTLIILKVGDNDSGKYTCVAENYLGKTNATATGILLERTQLVVKPQNKTVVKGTGVDLHCKATADPLLELIYIWKRNGADITKDANIQWQGGESVLQLSDISFKDTGVYTCVVYTPEPRGSEDSASAIVSIAGVPSPPINLQVTDCYDRRTNLSWTPDSSGSSEITHYLIERESNHDPFVFNLIYNVTNPNTTSLTLDLPGWSSLQFRVKAVNNFGPSRPSVATGAGICITPVGSPDKFPMNLRGVPKKANELSITWTPMSKLEWNGPGCYYILRYRKANNDSLAPWESEKIGDPRVHVFAVSDPGYYQLWEFKIRAGNHENLGPESPIKSSYSGQNAPAVKPEGTETEAVTASTVALAWKPVTLSKGSVDGYKIYYWGESRLVISRRRRQVIPSDAGVITVMGGQTQQATLSGLKPYTNYKVVVKAFNSGGEGPASTLIVFQTLEGEPSPPSDLQTYAFGEYILVTWKPPKDPNGNITNYQVGSDEYNASSPDTASVTMQNVGPGVFKKLLGSLSFEKSYVVEVRAKTTKGWGESARTITTTIKKSAPAKPKTPTVMEVGEDSISFMYHFGEGGGWTHEFKILYRKKEEGGEFQETDWVDHFSTQGIKVTDLETEVYEFKTIGRNPVGTSPPSNVTEAKPQEGPVIGRAKDDPPIYRSDWFITLIILSAGTLLLLVIILVYRTWKRRRSSNFKVSEHEKQEEPNEQIEEGIPVDIEPREKWRKNLQDRLEEESQADSLDEYGGGTAYFAEDGSFVGDLKQGRNTDSIYDEIPEPAV